MNDYFIHKNCKYTDLLSNLHHGFKKNPLYLPNNKLGGFCIDNKKLYKSILKNNILHDYESDLDPTNLYSNYIYKTRYSRSNAFNIKIDEYTLKRKSVVYRNDENIDWGGYFNDSDKNEYCYNYTLGNDDRYKNREDESINKKYAHRNKTNISNNNMNNNVKKPTNFMKNKKVKNYKNEYRIFTNDSDNSVLVSSSDDYSSSEIEILAESASKHIDLKENVKKNVTVEDPFGYSSLFYPPFLFNKERKNKKNKLNTYKLNECYRILSAPGIADDFYLNILDWSSRNIIAVGIDDKLCLYNNNTNKSCILFEIKKLKQIKKKKKKKKNDIKKYITSVKWNLFSNILAVGLSDGKVTIWDVEKGMKIRKYKNHTLRVGTLGWYYFNLSSGSKDTQIVTCDIRCKESNYNYNKNNVIIKHTSEVCGLQYNNDGKQLASGSNDNSVYIWDTRTDTINNNNNNRNALFHLEKHKAAVKAISYCPHKNNLLATGGGTADQKIYFWNTNTGECIDEIDTKTQVSNIMWLKCKNRIVSTHSYLSTQIIFWDYPDLNKLTTLTGHKSRVLYAALSPDHTSLITASPDETIRFWNIFPKQNNTDFAMLSPFTNSYEIVR
ncbi:cell division cycle protein 20 homolog, putative [Hepatocystis sp. ex Piliocolobus tephrosceles]|nr:cell division cycle protein 20 homolog, putative [Hepatocystis sp. ex Piliocolobus tephrosceles]